MTRKQRIIIAGAGLGGLCAALCLARQGFEVEVLERAPELAEVGAGIQISANAARVIDHLGLLPEMRRRGFEPEAAEIRDGLTGLTYFHNRLRGAHEARYGFPYIQIHRADLHDLLHDECRRQGIRVAIDNAVLTYRDFGTSVAAVLHGGQEVEGDLLIGADGLHSAVRARMLGPERPRFTGKVAWRGTIPANRLNRAKVAPTAGVWAGPGRHFVHYYLRGGELVNFVAIEERLHWDRESWTEAGNVAELRSAFAGWHETVQEIMGAVESTFLWGLFGRDRLPRWTEGRVALLGDACHPMLPFMAQGAAMAFEDAYVLARCLGRDADPLAALKAYEQSRIDRATRVQQQAVANARLFHAQGRLDQWRRLAPVWIASHLLPGIARGRFDWLYGHDVTD